MQVKVTSIAVELHAILAYVETQINVKVINGGGGILSGVNDNLYL